MLTVNKNINDMNDMNNTNNTNKVVKSNSTNSNQNVSIINTQLGENNTMLQRLTSTDLEKINNHGEEIYKTNEYLKYINDIMSNGDFEKFMENHLKSKNDVNVAMIYFNLYSIIKNQFKEAFKRDINKGEMLYFLRESMRNKIIRQFAIESANKYTNIESKVSKMINDDKTKRRIKRLKNIT